MTHLFFRLPKTSHWHFFKSVVREAYNRMPYAKLYLAGLAIIVIEAALHVYEGKWPSSGFMVGITFSLFTLGVHCVNSAYRLLDPIKARYGRRENLRYWTHQEDLPRVYKSEDTEFRQMLYQRFQQSQENNNADR